MPAAQFIGLLIMLLQAALAYGETSAAGGGVGEVVSTGSAEPFFVGPRKAELFFYPCSDCHEFMDSNDQIRELEVAEGHPAHLEHGADRIWCLSCHSGEGDYNNLRDLLGHILDLDNGYRVCAGCHSEQYRDWTHGAHGKRRANWRGDRELYSCVECHNPHQPAIEPRPPQPPPPVRAGLEPMRREPAAPARPWISRAEENSSE